MNTQVTVTALLVAATLLVGGCSKPSAQEAWSSSESIVVEPGVAIGSVHSGMTIQQVIAELGQPDRTVEQASPEIIRASFYKKIGVTVISGDGGAVVSVGVRPPFAGHTKEGIGMGASRADVVRAYGEPTAAKPIRPDVEVLRYEKLGIRFQLLDGKVDSIFVTLKDTK